MRLPFFVRLRLGVVGLIVFLAACLAARAGVPHDPFEAHKYLHAITEPRFKSAYNEFFFEHPVDADPKRPFDHVFQNDAKKAKQDLERGKRAREAAEELVDVLKRAGY
jgi:hypothetical protein